MTSGLLLIVWAGLTANVGATASVDVEAQFQLYLAAPDTLAPAVQSLPTAEARAAFGEGVVAAFERWPLWPAAAFALEASAALYGADHALSARLLELACKRLRRGPPTAFERLWHRAAVADLQGPLQFNKYPRSRRPLEPHLRHALGRFPADGALLFASGVYQERHIRDDLHLLVPSMQCPKCDSLWMTRSLQRQMERLAEVWERLEQVPVYTDAASLRLGLTRHWQGRRDDALAHWADVEARSLDVSRRYLAALFSARARHESGDVSGALAAYRRAHALRPSAQSAVVGLITVHFELGSRETAEKLAIDALTQPDDFGDPWVQYFRGDFDTWATRIAEVREAMR